MEKTKKRVVLLGASGTLGFETFKLLWQHRDQYEIVLLLLPNKFEKKLFRTYELKSGIQPIKCSGVVENNGLKIVWGDGAAYKDMRETIQGADMVLNAMAYISPKADYYPEVATAVNVTAVKNILRAIQEQPHGAATIRYVHIGTVAETGDRLPGIHIGRVGDPLKPSIFDFYALTKTEGERLVLESNLQYWVSLRMTFLMPTNFQKLISLEDPIMFHMPLNTLMEAISDRDAGLGLFNTLTIPQDSDFWRKVYNMGGGPGMRIDAITFYDRIYGILGLTGIRAISEPGWYAGRNFHLHFFSDSYKLNEYLHFWRDDFDAFIEKLKDGLSIQFRFVSFLTRNSRIVRTLVEKITYQRLRSLAENHRNSPLNWILEQSKQRISAFFNKEATTQTAKGWDKIQVVALDHPAIELDHGYDESKAHLELNDLQQAAAFRGGLCLSDAWDGDLYRLLTWQCAFGHQFNAKVYTILKAGHWCPVCVKPPWNYDEVARKNPFLAQVWYPNHAIDEENRYQEDGIQDIAGADTAYRDLK